MEENALPTQETLAFELSKSREYSTYVTCSGKLPIGLLQCCRSAPTVLCCSVADRLLRFWKGYAIFKKNTHTMFKKDSSDFPKYWALTWINTQSVAYWTSAQRKVPLWAVGPASTSQTFKLTTVTYRADWWNACWLECDLAFNNYCNWAPKKNTSHGNEVLPQDSTHLIQRPCYQRGSPCQDPAGNRTTRRPPDHGKEMQTAVVWSCLPFIRSGQTHLARHSERGKKTRQTEEEVGRQHQGMDRPGVRQVTEGSGEQAKMEETGCKIICGSPTTFAVLG